MATPNLTGSTETDAPKTGITFEVQEIRPDEDGRDVEALAFVDGVPDGRLHFESRGPVASRLEVGKTYEIRGK
jgi:hypothetical protein